jgi:hypothetical protein
MQSFRAKDGSDEPPTAVAMANLSPRATRSNAARFYRKGKGKGRKFPTW